MNFGEAIEALKNDSVVQRKGWNGKGMFLALVRPPQSASPEQLMWEVSFKYDRMPEQLLPWIGMKTADDCFVPWLASQTDMLAEDWEVLG